MSQVGWGIKGHFILNRVIVVYDFPVMPLELCGARSTAEIRRRGEGVCLRKALVERWRIVTKAFYSPSASISLTHTPRLLGSLLLISRLTKLT